MPTVETMDNLQEAVDAAHVCLLIASAREHGFMREDRTVDVARCELALRQGQKHNVFPLGDERTLANCLERKGRRNQSDPAI